MTGSERAMTSISSSKAPQARRRVSTIPTTPTIQNSSNAQLQSLYPLMSPIHYPVSSLTACLCPLSKLNFERFFFVKQSFRSEKARSSIFGTEEPARSHIAAFQNLSLGKLTHPIGSFLGSTFSTPIFSIPKETITQLVVLVCSIPP